MSGRRHFIGLFLERRKQIRVVFLLQLGFVVFVILLSPDPYRKRPYLVIFVLRQHFLGMNEK